MTEQLCPLCDSTATYKISHQPHCKHFTCSVCMEFFIDSSSESYIAGLSETTKSETRQKLSKLAKSCKPDHVFVIREPRDDERGGDGRSVARTQLISEFRSHARA